MKNRLARWILPVLLLTGCETTNVAPHQGATTVLEPDERRIWQRSREEQHRLDASDFHVQLPEVESYLQGIIARLHAESLPDGGAFRARVLVDPTLNAFTLPDGAIYVHTGLLAAVANEAQLATVLAHEIVHTLHRHALKGTRQLKNQSAFLATLGAGSLGVGLAGSVVHLLGAVGSVAAITGYSRELEREADMAGFGMLVAAGYDPRETPSVFRAMILEADRAKHPAPFFFSTHPKLQDRIDSYNQLLAALPAERVAAAGRVGREDYEAMLPRPLALNAESALRRGDFDGAQANAERFLQLRPDEPHLKYVVAEAKRKRGTPSDTTAALAMLRGLTETNPDFADAHRSLGLVLMKADQRREAAASFHRYLELRPGAGDRGYILDFIRQCGN